MKLIPYFICLLIITSGTANALEKPNVIIFYVDDLGWQDTQLHDLDAKCPYETPNLIKLAARGMTFSQAYSPAPSCSPSRAGILTGQHPAQIGITHVDLGKIFEARPSEQFVSPYLDGHLNFDHLTLAQSLKANGYKTGHVGKWHVGYSAANYGFDFVDHTRGVHRGMNDRTKDFATAKDRRYPLSKEKYAPFSKNHPKGISYPYDQVTASAIAFIEQSKNEPFFLNQWHWMVHWPVLTRNGELLEYYCDKLGQPFPPKPGDMTLDGQQNPYFAAMVTTVDWSLGRLMDYLQKTDDPRYPGKKLSETTYLFFSSDNGGAERHANEIISDNFPLKYGKTHTEEGGVRVPMVVTGPGIPAASHYNGLASQLDYFPTILELTDSKIAAEKRKLLSGADLSGVLSGASKKVIDTARQDRTHLFWHYPHGRESKKSAIRQGDFKLYKHALPRSNELYRLYKNGVREDLEETVNQINNPEYAAVAKRLSNQLDADLKTHLAEGPYLNPLFNNKTIQPATITGTSQSGQRAKLTVDPKGPSITKAHVIYLPAPDALVAEHARGRVVEIDPTASQVRVKIPAEVTDGGYSIVKDIPNDVVGLRFVFVDSENFLHYSDAQTVKPYQPPQ